MVCLFLAGFGGAAVSTKEPDILPCTTAFSVALTTFSWTRVPTSNCGSRDIVRLVNPEANSAEIVGIISTSTVTPITATTTFSLQINDGSDDRDYRLPDDMYLWMSSKHSATEAIKGQELKERSR